MYEKYIPDKIQEPTDQDGEDVETEQEPCTIGNKFEDENVWNINTRRRERQTQQYGARQGWRHRGRRRNWGEGEGEVSPELEGRGKRDAGGTVAEGSSENRGEEKEAAAAEENTQEGDIGGTGAGNDGGGVKQKQVKKRKKKKTTVIQMTAASTGGKRKKPKGNNRS